MGITSITLKRLKIRSGLNWERILPHHPHPTTTTTFSIHEAEKSQMPGKGHNNVCPKYLLFASIYNGIALYEYSVYCFLCTVYCNRKFTLKIRMNMRAYLLYSVYCVYLLRYSFSNMCEIMLTNIYLFTHAHSHCLHRQHTVDSSLSRRQKKQDVANSKQNAVASRK